MTDKTSQIPDEQVRKSYVRWENGCKVNLKLHDVEGDVLKFTLDNQHFNLVIPDEKDGFICLDYDTIEPGFDWIAEINNYIFNIGTNPSFGRIMRHIEKEYTKYKKDIDTTQIDLLEDDDIISQFDINEMQLRSKLEKNLSTMESKMSLENDSAKVSALFTGNKPGLILLNELMKIRGIYKNNSKISVDPIEDNVYEWKLTFRNFANKELDSSLNQIKQTHGYDFVEINIVFHSTLYPAYPPFIKVVRPRMLDSLMHRITNIKMTQLEYWSPTRSMEFVINKLHKILDEHCRIDLNSEMNDTTVYKEGAYHDVEAILVKLASLCDAKDEFEPLDTEDYPKIYNFGKSSDTSSSKSSNSGYKSSSKNINWKQGTGYGYGGSSNWNIEEYLRLQKEKDVQIISILNSIVETVQNTDHDSLPTLATILQYSYLVPFIKSYLRGTNMVEMTKHKDIFKVIFSVLQNFANEECVFLFVGNSENNIYNLLKEIYEEANTVKEFEKNATSEVDADDGFDEDILEMVIFLYEILSPNYKVYMENMKKKVTEEKEKYDKKLELAKSTTDPQHLAYMEKMRDLVFDTSNFVPDQFYYSKGGKTTVSSSVTRPMARRLAREFSSMKKNLPVFFESSIFFRVDEKNTRCLKVMITGPDDTPYDSGIFMFDVYITDNYPAKNPLMIFLNTGGIRFNPNLYVEGKVCLSLLGTWSGTASENWNPETSTIMQLLISAQSQILISDPIWNEPGYESHNNGKQESKNANNFLRCYTMQHAMVGILNDLKKYPGFEEVIINHFKLKKEYIYKTCQKWIDEAYESSSGMQNSGTMTKARYVEQFEKLKKLVDKL